MGDVDTLLTDVGDGLGGIFDGIALPLATLVILLVVAGMVGAILSSVASVIKRQ